MQIENHKEEVPFAYYEEKFRELNPEAVTARLSDVTWDGNCFALKLLGREFAITHPDYTITPKDSGKVPPLATQTFLLRYLLECKDVAWKNQWKTFREMPWGEMYIKPYTGRVLTRAAFTFGTRLDAFRAAAEHMGAIPVPHGDAGYLFELVGGYRMQILVWAGDEEFPPRLRFLWDENVLRYIRYETTWYAAGLLLTRLKEKMP